MSVSTSWQAGVGPSFSKYILNYSCLAFRSSSVNASGRSGCQLMHPCASTGMFGCGLAPAADVFVRGFRRRAIRLQRFKFSILVFGSVTKEWNPFPILSPLSVQSSKQSGYLRTTRLVTVAVWVLFGFGDWVRMASTRMHTIFCLSAGLGLWLCLMATWIPRGMLSQGIVIWCGQWGSTWQVGVPEGLDCDGEETGVSTGGVWTGEGSCCALPVRINSCGVPSSWASLDSGKHMLTLTTV